jgi:hypothetical protein
MRLIAFDIPDDAAELPGWLESHLVGLELSALVAELEAVHHWDASAPEPPVSIETVLGKDRDAVLSSGLGALPRGRIRQLLRHPSLLLDLQELIVTSGHPYWQDRAKDDLARELSAQAAIDRGWAQLKVSGMGGLPASSSSTRRASLAPLSAPVNAPRVRPRWRMLAASGLAAAAAVVFAVAVWPWQAGVQRRPDAGDVAAASWGWNRPGALPQDLAPRDYLNHLADTAHEWFNKRPQDPDALARRIAEFRKGCTVLIESPHRPLSAADREWLVGKCRDWSAKLDAHLADLQSGHDLREVHAQADETVNKLVTALRSRAAESG